MVKVSVVVPVYNPGRHLRRCLDSLVGQTLPIEAYEVIFVDDGSTDGTAVALDEAAGDHPQIRVIHQPNSGWPGQPRNRGLDAARGDYVFFCDGDDWLAAEALEVLHRFAVENGSDIVLGKMGGVGRPVPRVLFTRTRSVATLADAPLMDSLTVHKLFRRAFLIEKDIRFAEGRRRLEDHLFMVQAYLEAAVISVYAEQTCYFHVRATSNISARPPHWPSYFADLEEAVEVVEQHTDPGPFRDRLLSRWVRVEMVGRLSGNALAKRSPHEVAALFDAAHQVARRHFGDGVVALISPADRPVSRAIVAGTLPVIWEQAARLAHWHVEARILQLGWTTTTLQLRGTVDLTDDAPAVGVDARFADLFTDVEETEVHREIAAAAVKLDLERRSTGERLPVRATTQGAGLSRSFTAEIDIHELAVDTTIGSSWSFHAQFQVLGVGGRVPVRGVDERSLPGPLAPASVTEPRAAVTFRDDLAFELLAGPAADRAEARVRRPRAMQTLRRRLGRSIRRIKRRLAQRTARTA
jgi:poly(ribitol-phosphate) beta-N-acetylglucosaminyltransferase